MSDDTPIDAKQIVENLATGDTSETSDTSETTETTVEQAQIPEVIPLPKNLATDKKIVKLALAKLNDYLKRYTAQNGRIAFLEKCQIADAMYRVSKRRQFTDADDQKQDTLSNVASTSFYDSMRTITAGQKAVIFYNDELPVKFEKLAGNTVYPNSDEADRLERENNLLLRYTFDIDKWQGKTKKSMHYANKYGLELLRITWDRQTDKRMEKIPVIDPEGKMVGYKLEERERIVVDWPVLTRCDIKDSWFDALIDDAQDQMCILERMKMQPYAVNQKRGDNDAYLNVEKLGEAQLFKDEIVENEEVKNDRLENAGENPEVDDSTGHYEIWYCWVRLPIEKTDGGGYKWNKKAAPVWFETTWAGHMGSGNEICLQLRENPYWHKKNPYQLVHSHEDDKGAYHMGYATLLECLYEEETTTVNQLIDNKTLRNKAPFIGEKGNVLEKKLVWGANKIFNVKAGTSKTALTRLEVPDTTGSTQNDLAYIERRFNRTAGTDKPITGEAWGSRTTATEAAGIQQQAMKPALEDAEYVAEQRFPWMAEMCRELWKQFADPDRVIAVTGDNKTYEFKPASLYGDFNTKIVTIGQFEGDMLRRQNENDFIARVVIPFQAFFGKKGLQLFLQDVMKGRKFSNPTKYFDTPPDGDATRVAWNENVAILMGGVTDIPQPTENHDIHLSIHTPARDKYALLPKEQVNPDNLKRMDMHILGHNQLKEQAELGAQQQSQIGALQSQMQLGQGGGNQFGPPAAEGMAPQMAGEMVGDMAGGEAGGMVAGGGAM